MSTASAGQDGRRPASHPAWRRCSRRGPVRGQPGTAMAHSAGKPGRLFRSRAGHQILILGSGTTTSAVHREKPGFIGVFRCSPGSETEWLKTRESGVDKAWRRGLYTAQHGAPTLRRDGAPPKLLTDSGGRNSDQARRIKFRRPSGSGRVGAFGPGLFDR